MAKIKAGGRKATLKTVAGSSITISMQGKKLRITDTLGGKSYVTIKDVNQSNRVIHVADGMLVPKG